jgi:hypothetical protein
MLDGISPTYTARVSPELVLLLKGEAQVNRQADMPEEQCARVDPPYAPVWTQVKLRRDGGRPFYGEALLVCACKNDVHVEFHGVSLVVRQNIAVYLRSIQRPLLHISYHPPEGYPARPVYQVFQPETADDLSDILNDFGPENCFSVSAQPAARKSPRVPFPLSLSRLGTCPAIL